MKSAIFKTFFLSLAVLASMEFAHSQTASILPPGYTQYLDNNGKPLTSGKVYNYIPSTTTFKTTWQDSAEAIANTNPVILDAGGRAKILGDGNYRQIVKDRNNNTIWDAVTSSTGSGSVTPTTATGDGDLVGTIKPWAGMTAPNQYAFTYGQEISRTTYAVLFTAITSTQSIFCNSGSPTLSGVADTTNFWVGMSVEVSCVATGTSTVISKTSSSVTLAANANTTTNTNAIFFPWGRGNGSTTFNLPDFRGLTLVGNNIMGGVAGSFISSTYFGSTGPNSAGAFGGADSTILTTPNLPPYTPTGTISGTVTSVYFLGSASVSTTRFALAQGSGDGTSSLGNTLAATFSGVAQGGTSSGISRVQPSKTTNYIIKITPDTNSATASGVTSIQSMTGDIACGTGLLCTGNTISLTTSALPVPYTVGDLLVANSTTTLTNLPDVSAGRLFVAGGVGVAPAWSTVGIKFTDGGGSPLLKITRNSTAWTPLGTTSIFIQGADSGEARLEMDAANSDSVLACGRMNTSFANPTPVLAGEQICGWSSQAIDRTDLGVTGMQQGGALGIFATATWSNTSHPSDFRFYSIATGTTTFIEALRVLNSGGIWVNKNGSATGPITSGITSPVIQSQAADGSATVAAYDSFGTSTGSFGIYRSARGTAASFTATQSLDTIGGFGWIGASAANTFPNPLPFGSAGGAFILAQASQTWTAGAQGTSLQFYTTPNGSATIGGTVSLMVLNQSGGLGVGTTTDPGGGVILANVATQVVATTVGSLGTCNAAAKAQRKFVTDSNAAITAGIGAIVAAGGANNVPVVCDGTNWRIG